MEDLIEASKAGDLKAFDKLIDHYSSTVERFAFQIGVPYHDVPDVSQEVFIRIYRFLDQFDGNTFTSWLYKITLNVARDYGRKQSSWIHKFTRLRQEKVNDLNTRNLENEVISDEEDQRLHACIRQLDKKYRIPIVLHYFHDLPYDHISKITGVKLSTLKVRVMRAKKLLAAQMVDNQAEGGAAHG